MFEKVKDLFSCGSGSVCRKKDVIVLEITNSNNCGMLLNQANNDSNFLDTKNKQIDGSLITASNIDFNTTTDLSNYSKSISSINPNIIVKHNSILNQINEEHEDDTGDHTILPKSSSKEIEEEDTFRKGKKKRNEEIDKNHTILIESEKLKPYWVDKIVILDQEIYTNKTFELTDEQGSLLFNQRLILNAAGLANSLRQLRDGHAFFGTIESYKSYIINDFILNKEKTEHNKRLFMIYFDRKDSGFFIKNLEESKASVYLKLTKSIFIESKCYTQIGDELIKFALTNDKTLQVTAINKKSSITYLFAPTIKTISIGRSDQCNIIINSNLISKIQCTIRFVEPLNKWEIIDGHDKKPSTNGTWFLSQNVIPLCRNDDSREQMYIKLGQEIIKITKL